MEFLKKISASLLFAIYLFSATNSGELLKLPMLIEHYCEHQSENNDISVISFLIRHYCTENDTDQDAAEDNELPFKSQQHCAGISLISLPPSFCVAVPSAYDVKNVQAFKYPVNSFLPAQYLAAIWQPPRHC